MANIGASLTAVISISKIKELSKGRQINEPLLVKGHENPCLITDGPMGY